MMADVVCCYIPLLYSDKNRSECTLEIIKLAYKNIIRFKKKIKTFNNTKT